MSVVCFFLVLATQVSVSFSLVSSLFACLPPNLSLVLNLFFADSSSNYRGVEDIFNCRIQASEICFPGDGNTQEFWDKVATPIRASNGCSSSEMRPIRGPCTEDEKQEISSRKRKRKALLFDRVKSGLNLVKQYRDGKTQNKCSCRYFFGPRTAAVFLLDTKEFCSKVTSIGEPFYTNLLGFVLPPDSEWTADLSSATLQAISNLSIPSPTEYGRSELGTNLNACSFNDESLLRFSALRGFFIVAWSFLCAVWLFMCISIVTRLVDEKCGPSSDAVAP